MDARDPKIRAAITEAAAQWFAAHRAGALSQADRAEFLAWVKASPQHIEEYLGIAALERPLGTASEDPSLTIEALQELARSEGGEVVDFATAQHWITPRVAAGSRWRVAAAAASVGAAGILAIWVARPWGHDLVRATTYRTGHGEQGAWPLPDGSTLHVNTDTAVTVRFSGAERLLDLDHGQVAVEVAHDGRTFRVHAGSTDAVAVGTKFDVYRRPNATSITVMAGQIAVSVGPYPTPRAASAELPGGLRVAAGQRVTVVDGRLPAAAEPGDVQEATAWLERKIVFEQRPLAAVADEFNRYNDVSFTVEDPALRDLRISGVFNAADTESFASFLATLQGVRVERHPDGYRILNLQGNRSAAPRSS